MGKSKSTSANSFAALDAADAVLADTAASSQPTDAPSTQEAGVVGDRYREAISFCVLLVH